MSSNYYNMQDAKIRIAHALMSGGWEVKGYHADESNSMTDYYSPAYWNGIATKNGYILVIDNRAAAEARDITQYSPKGNISSYEIIGKSLAHMGNPSTSKWHIEKDGKIYDKGTGITKYSNMPNEYEYDIVKMEYKSGHDYYRSYETDENGYRKKEYRILPDETKKIINEFKTLILRFEAIVTGANSCGDGTAETEQAAAAQTAKAGYQKVTITEYKTEYKTVIIETPEIITEGMYFILNSNFNYNCYKGIVYHINETRKNTYNENIRIESNRMNPKLTKILTGSASSNNHFSASIEKFNNWITKGSISICKIEEVKTPYDIEKWVKVDEAKPITKAKPEQKAEIITPAKPETTEQPTTNNNINFNFKYTIAADTDTRNNNKIYVLKLTDKLSKEEYIKASEQLKALKGYYSKFKKGFIFKYNPFEVLQGSTSKTPEQENIITETQEPTTETQEAPEQNNNITLPNTDKATAESITDASTNIIIENAITDEPEETTEQEQNTSNIITDEQRQKQIIT